MKNLSICLSYGRTSILDTIPETELDVENLVPIPSESEVTSDNENTFINSSPKFDYILEEFSGELAHINPIPPGIEEADFDLDDSLWVDMIVFLLTDDSMPPGIENDDYELKGDIRFLEELLSNDSSSLPENESSDLDYFNDPSSPRSPPKSTQIVEFL
ncbi:hypothetical protein Tco_0039670 [Tanacetum coccineum]